LGYDNERYFLRGHTILPTNLAISRDFGQPGPGPSTMKNKLRAQDSHSPNNLLSSDDGYALSEEDDNQLEQENGGWWEEDESLKDDGEEYLDNQDDDDLYN
jgi:hypothetical protein